MITGISRFTKGEFDQAALDEVWNKGKELYKDPTTPPSSGIMENNTDIIWDDSNGENIGWTCATGDMVQFRGPDTREYYRIGDSSKGYRIPSANMWDEVEEEGDGSTCSHSINQATNTRVETTMYYGWWLDGSGQWNEMTGSPSQGGSHHPPDNGLVTGERGCSQQYFMDERADFDRTKLIRPYGEYNPSLKYQNSSSIHIFVKPQDYFRFHGWTDRLTIYNNDYEAKNIFFQIFARLVVDDPALPDDRHLARYLIHTGSDRKEWAQDPNDGVWKWMQMWNIGISRFKRVTNDWQPYNLYQGPQSKAELEANPPPFMTTP